MKWLLSILLVVITVELFSQTLMLRSRWIFDGEQKREEWVLVTEGPAILYAGPGEKYTSPVDSIIDFGEGTIMPGMIEGHSHVLLYPYDRKSWNDQVLKESRSLRAIRGAKMATRNLMAGFTTIRDLGSEGAAYADVAIKQSIEEGIIEGPRMLVAGKAIVATGSYGPKGFHPDFEVPLGAEEADGNDLIRVVRDQIGKGADFIKVYADYRWGPQGESRPTFTIEELKLIVETASSSGRVVVAHANSTEAMRRAALAGVATIEHGSEATDEVLRLMKENSIGLCPTLAATESILKYRGWNKGSDPDPPAIIQKKEMFQMAMKSGVKIVAGGDVGVFEHGENVMELELMVEYGMPLLDVLKTATSGNADVLGLKDRGRLQPGHLADIVVVKGDPTENISNLREVVMVMKNGRIYKN